MRDLADKPFMDVLGEDIRIDPHQGVFANVGSNLLNAGNKIALRNQYRDRARQMNQALQQWRQNQAAMRQRMTAQQPQQQPGLWPKRPTAYLE